MINSPRTEVKGHTSKKSYSVRAFRSHNSRLILLPAVPLLGASWALMWSQDTFWNPLFFVGMWTGATLLMYGFAPNGYPGWRSHALLMAVAVPVWWWFELVNSRVGNWEYINQHDYTSVEYFLLASLAFSTVVPALHAAWSLTTPWLRPPPSYSEDEPSRRYVLEASAGALTLASVFILPEVFFPFAWVAPFLILDGLVGYRGGRSIAAELAKDEWRLAAAVGLAGLLCGILWEFWNYWSTPKWIYHVPHFDFLQVFEMPLLGYGGYVPFAWGVYQLLQLGSLKAIVGRKAVR